ncbi:hypothetical protein [Propylenella binzhouense]|uniref:Uncharacterized protein n=1 Tax=Propylenella binzhouense TaxID=2555902 RepID=A0A964T2P1_9HYPH|nr:hypothetical protein [Propylenella binzhouense]MYZ47140.1 hypothetical protein [Propylenella binzhouense]
MSRWSQAVRLVDPARAALAAVWTKPLARVMAATLAATLAYVAFLATLPSPRPLLILKARTEQASFVVSNADVASFAVSGLMLATDDADPACIGGVVQPRLGSSVSYRRSQSGSLAIVIASDLEGGAGRIEAEDGAVHPLGTFATLVSDPDACGPWLVEHMPIWGPARFGEVLRGQPDMMTPAPAALLEGELAIYGRAIESWLGIGLQGGLYSIETLDLPAGGFVEADRALPVREQDWWGIIRPDSELGLFVAASTEAPLLRIFTPGPNAAPETIAVSTFTQSLNDPNLVGVQIVAAAAIVIVQLFAALAGLQKRKPVA